MTDPNSSLHIAIYRLEQIAKENRGGTIYPPQARAILAEIARLNQK